MKRSDTIDQLAGEIERLAKMHILYGLNRSPQFEAQKEKIKQVILFHRINVRAELDTVSKNLYCRYFD